MTREDREKALALALLASWKKFENKRQISWPAFQAAIRPALAANLTSIYTASARDEAGDRDLPGLERVAERWADVYAKKLAADIAATTREQIEEAKRKKDREELVLALLLAFSSSRAEMIAVTETTRAISHGQRSAVSFLFGDKLVPHWICEEDACDVCSPLDDEPIEMWADLFPDGPPAHPRCRCRLKYRPRD